MQKALVTIIRLRDSQNPFRSFNFEFREKHLNKFSFNLLAQWHNYPDSRPLGGECFPCTDILNLPSDHALSGRQDNPVTNTLTYTFNFIEFSMSDRKHNPFIDISRENETN